MGFSWNFDVCSVNLIKRHRDQLANLCIGWHWHLGPLLIPSQRKLQVMNFSCILHLKLPLDVLACVCVSLAWTTPIPPRNDKSRGGDAKVGKKLPGTRRRLSQACPIYVEEHLLLMQLNGSPLTLCNWEKGKMANITSLTNWSSIQGISVLKLEGWGDLSCSHLFDSCPNDLALV